jgi:cysteinyl-tRNA synthetase
MSSRWLGDQIDVHHGGEDLVFPHHENEVAQSEGASGKAPFVRYWMHSAFLTMSKEKMSKSLGNVFLAREFLGKFGGEVARAMLLSVHYRSMIDFNDDTVEQALTGLQRIYEAKSKALEIAGSALQSGEAVVLPVGAGEPWASFMAECEVTRREIDENFANDFNSAGALAALFLLIRSFNRLVAESRDFSLPGAVACARALMSIMENDIGGILGFGMSSPRKMLDEIERIRSLRPAADGAARPTEEEIKGFIVARADARKAKNFAEADRIRKELEARGVILKDGPAGTTWSYS